jgi:DNA-binding NarL/FixJ family response regulator
VSQAFFYFDEKLNYFFIMTTVNTNTSTIQILIVDDQNLIRETIQMYLEPETDLKVVGHAENGATALTQIENLTPDVVILDLEMPDTNAIKTIETIRDRFIHTKILVLSSHDDQNNINRAIKAGAKGYLTKGTPARELAHAVRSINQGYFQLGPGLMEKLVISISNSATENSRTLEEKLIVALKRFKQDSNQQIEEVVKSELTENLGYLNHQLDLTTHSLKKKHNDLYTYARKIEYKVYLLLLFQVLFAFTLAIIWIM